jgi:hypothetical protein
MRVFLFIFLMLISSSFALAQDGSDMSYVEIKNLNKSHAGRWAHPDFYNLSSPFRTKNVKIDTVSININGRKIDFIEHRVDDGYNNWFREQYLESVEDFDGLKLRLTKCKILKIKKDSISVTGYFDYFDAQNEIVPKKSFTEKLSFKKKRIVEVLLKSE